MVLNHSKKADRKIPTVQLDGGIVILGICCPIVDLIALHPLFIKLLLIPTLV